MIFTDNGLIGIDLGATKVAAGRVDNNQLGEVVYKLIPALSENPWDIIDVIVNVTDILFDKEVLSIGIGIPGLVDREKGIISDVQNIPSWKEVHLKTILEEQFKVPVYIDNDANCFALGESRFGNGKEEDDFVGLTLGSGMGGGIIKNGFLLTDAHCGSGEFGNIPYLSGIYEDYCSGKFFVKKYGLKGEAMAMAAEEGDKFALKAFREFGIHLANAIKTIKLAVDPKKIIVGGSVAQSNEFFKVDMWKELLDFPFPKAMYDFDVIFSNMENIAVLGAASLYFDRIKQAL
ncbi:hypothetical protein MNBD_BACTEROID07-677 [hydrothermal vent metagenome]|uniref:Glucokinase n=1 Tax=hydrothermal vent metagenome TaxID=652676 RepID=A0A3B0UXG7_9ZZZZ